MKRQQQNGIQWLEFDLFQQLPGLKHGFFLRQGGHSKDPYASLNLSYEVDDLPEAVDQNRESVLRTLQIEHPLYEMHQVHGTEVALVTKDSPSTVARCDVLLTNSEGCPLMIKHADCQAAVIYDPEHHAVAAVHAGWRGLVRQVYTTAVTALGDFFGSHPKNLLVGIAPSLGPQASQFKNYREEIPESLWSYIYGDRYLNLWALARGELETNGVPLDQVELIEICTYSNPNECFSYRRDRITGRHGTFVELC